MLVTRPQPEAARTAARLTALGHEVVVAPLLSTIVVDWQLPVVMPEAVAFTSAAAVRLAGPQLMRLRHLPVFAVGEATAAAAREAGFEGVAGGTSECVTVPAHLLGGTAAALFAQISASGLTRVLYLAARDRAARALPPGVELRVVYAATLLPELPQPVLSALAAGVIELTLLYSARTAAHFATLADAAGLDHGQLRIAALSSQVLAAAGPGWASAVVTPQPTETALLSAAGLLQGAPVLQPPS